jgi:hypothetical protein
MTLSRYHEECLFSLPSLKEGDCVATTSQTLLQLAYRGRSFLVFPAQALFNRRGDMVTPAGPPFRISDSDLSERWVGWFLSVHIHLAAQVLPGSVVMGWYRQWDCSWWCVRVRRCQSLSVYGNSVSAGFDNGRVLFLWQAAWNTARMRGILDTSPSLVDMAGFSLVW